MTVGPTARAVLAALAALVGCEGDPSPTDGSARSEPPPSAPSSPDPPAPARAEPPPPSAASAPAPAAPAPAKVQDEPASPPEVRRAVRALRVFAEPSIDAAFRGRIPRDEPFAVVGRVAPTPDCPAPGWGRVGIAAFVCLEDTTETDASPVPLPRVPDGQLTPFFYFRRPKKAPPDAEPPGIWRSRGALARGDAAVDHVQPEHDYAFVSRRRGRGGPFLVDDDYRVVREKQVERLVASDFAGRDVTADPIPDGVELAWSVHWPGATIFAEPREDAEAIAQVELHASFHLTGETRTHRRTEFWALAAPGHGWVEAKQARRWLPFEAPAEVGAEQLWIDVDLEQQTLALMEGSTPRFVTLVSTGGWKNPTPTGLFRIISKEGHDDMRSRPDEDDPYIVEGVPWAQYFDGRYALHGTFWHNRFGLRTSHGCVNLSARDARRVFDATAPALPPGWLTVYEHADDKGTLLRIRKGAEHPRDRRDDVRQRIRSDYR